MGYHLSLHKSKGWKGQLLRVERWHQRLTKAAKTGNVDIEDFAYAFFQNAFHLRDWIGHEYPKQKDHVFKMFKQPDELGLCRDLANATKHLQLSKPASVDENISVAREYDPFAPSKIRLSVLADGHYDLLELADRCLARLRSICEQIGEP